ncbi:class I SAM-dependent methyltransferase [Nocardia sp. NPDC058058]|uniref:class I SAM-dependent methyltransferase n=1 Tax=Nocardia sp. NPDC058058 TaxID=3346317 RepID=UPI0036D96039
MRPSFTAQTMALQRAMETARPERSRLFSDPLATAFLSGPLRGAAALVRAPLLGRVAPRLYDLIWPGPRPSAVVRTRLIDDAIEAAVGDGIDQMVILGAGFDSRAWRLDTLRRARVIEIDRDETQAMKVEALRRVHAPVDSVRFVPVDFEHDDLESALRAAELDTAKPALFLWEGVTNYLTAEAVDHTLEIVRRLSAPGSTLVFTFVHSGVLDGTVKFPEADRWVRSVAKVGEPWTFGLNPADLRGYLDDRGFELLWEESTAAAGRRYFAPTGRADRASELYRVAAARVVCPG